MGSKQLGWCVFFPLITAACLAWCHGNPEGQWSVPMATLLGCHPPSAPRAELLCWLETTMKAEGRSFWDSWCQE